MGFLILEREAAGELPNPKNWHWFNVRIMAGVVSQFIS